MKRALSISWISILASLLVISLLILNETTPKIDNLSPLRIFSKNRGTTPIIEDSQNRRFSDLESLIQNSKGTFGLYIKDIDNNIEYEINSSSKFYPLSLYKVPISYIIVRDIENEDISWEDTLTYTQSDYYDQYGTIASSGFGSEYSLDKVIELMLRESDNTAFKMISNLLGEAYLNSEFRKMTGNKKIDLFDEYSETSPIECSVLMENIFFKGWLEDENVEKILSFMYPTSYDNTLSLYFDEELTYYHKVGIYESMYHDCGVVRGESKNIIVCLMSKDSTEESLNFVSKKTAEFINEL